ncbi:MAG: hypothetical protein JRG96_03670 [Deltaproteobacteria bacterium]|nr:hypothetical protein [Deltaproteobacteria bacterium]
MEVVKGGASSPQRGPVLQRAVTAEVGRYAPSTTGPAHPGTLLAALLCWLDARSRGARLILRLEDLDPERCRPEYSRAMVEDLAWLGLEWDEVVEQHQARSDHEAALDRLAELGVLYPCSCSRAQIRATGGRSHDGGARYPGTCRERPLPSAGEGGWRSCGEALRVRLPSGVVRPADEGGLDLAQDPLACFGDPVVRRRDGALAYHLACVVDDHWSGVTRVVRGRDLASSTATQVVLQQLLDFRLPVYRHHLLLLEPAGGKLAKFHGSVGTPQLRAAYTPEQLCGLLAHAVGLRASPDPLRPESLLPDFAWPRIHPQDQVLHWTGHTLTLHP